MVNVLRSLGVKLGGFDLGKPYAQPIQFRERVTNPFRPANKFKHADTLLHNHSSIMMLIRCCQSLHYRHLPQLRTQNVQMHVMDSK